MATRVAIYIGRFSPLHNGHVSIMKHALETYDKLILVIGSAYSSKSIKNPWSAEERKFMIKASSFQLPVKQQSLIDNLEIVMVEDTPYNDQIWLSNINEAISNMNAIKNNKDVEYYLVGADRDDSTYYLKMFPKFKKDIQTFDDEVSPKLSATIIRDLIFANIFNNHVISNDMKKVLMTSFMPSTVVQYLNSYETTEDYFRLKNEYEIIKKYKESWKVAPYPVQFITVDSVVIQSGHVLVIQRKSAPGEGLYALPGGFLEANETAINGAIRELKEETAIKIQEQILRGSVTKKEIFDKPDRSARGRTLTIAYCFNLKDDQYLPIIKGGDDASNAFWMPISELKQNDVKELFFEDHLAIINWAIGS